MVFVTDYICMDCGLEITDDGWVFVWDSKSNQTEDFLNKILCF